MKIKTPKIFTKAYYLKNNMSHQFWSYETGNIFGAIAGGGGFAATSKIFLQTPAKG